MNSRVEGDLPQRVFKGRVQAKQSSITNIIQRVLEPAAVPPAVEGEDRRPPIILLRLPFDDALGYRVCDDTFYRAAAEGDGVGALRRERGVGGEGPGRHALLSVRWRRAVAAVKLQLCRQGGCKHTGMPEVSDFVRDGNRTAVGLFSDPRAVPEGVRALFLLRCGWRLDC